MLGAQKNLLFATYIKNMISDDNFFPGYLNWELTTINLFSDKIAKYTEIRSSIFLKNEHIGAPLNLKSIGRLMRLVTQLLARFSFPALILFSGESVFPNRRPIVLLRLCIELVKNLKAGYCRNMGGLFPWFFKTLSAEFVLCSRNAVIMVSCWPSGGNFCWIKCL